MLKQPIQLMMVGFGMCSYNARLTVLLDEGPNLGPGVIMSNELQGLVLTIASRSRVVVIMLKNSESKVFSIWDIYTVI